MKIRLDKYLSNIWFCSRKESSKLAKKWLIKVNGEIVKKSDTKISLNDKIQILWQEIQVKTDICILLHKPAGYVSSNTDEWNWPSYRKLLKNCPYVNMLNIAWRLDVDTEWLLVLLSNGKQIHQLISPKKWKEKIYYVELEKDLSKQDIEKLENWVKIQDNYITAWARVLKLENIEKEEIQKFWNFKKTTLNQIPSEPIKGKIAILLAIKEWKFHQIKNMALSINNKVLYLKRLKLDQYELEDLQAGEWKML